MLPIDKNTNLAKVSRCASVDVSKNLLIFCQGSYNMQIKSVFFFAQPLWKAGYAYC